MARREYVYVQCQNDTGQICVPMKKFVVDVTSSFKINFTVFPTHCAPLILHIYLDENKVTSVRLGYINKQNETIGDLSTGNVTFGVVTPGKHELSLQAEGILEGCNDGTILSWGGYLDIET